MPFPSPRLFRQRSNWLIAVATELGAPLLRAYARAKTGPSSPQAEWRKALIVGANHIGDTLFRSASLPHLKAGFPQCEFHYLTTGGSAQVIEGDPAIAAIHPWIIGNSLIEVSTEHFAALREMKFDAILCTDHGKYWPSLLFALRLGIPNRVAYNHKGFSALATVPIGNRYPQPFIAYFRDYVAALTGQEPTWPLRPIIHTSDKDQTEAEALWDQLGLARHAHVTASFMTSRQPTGIWPPEKFGQALAALRGKRETHIVLCGAASDEGVLARINREFDLGADVVAGGLGIRPLCAFLRRCSVVLTTDSGPRHIANAAGVPIVFARNVWFNAVEAGIYSGTEIDLCGPPHDGDRGDGDALLAAIDPGYAAEVVAKIAGV